MNITYIVLGAIAVIAFWLIALYNRFVTLVNRAKEAWSDIDVQLKRRYDLIPNLVGTVKAYAVHESQAFEKVSAARAAAMGARGLPDKGRAEQALSSAIGSLFAVAEAYPELKANQNFLQLQDELSDTENKIQAARRFYNTTVRDLTIGLESFPGNLINKAFSFEKREYFELEDDAAKEPVKVSF